MMKIPSQKKDELSSNSGKSPFTNIRYYIFIALLFLYSGTEKSINGWLTIYLDSLGVMNSITPQDILSIFWIAIILGRLISAGIYFGIFPCRYISNRCSQCQGFICRDDSHSCICRVVNYYSLFDTPHD